MMSLISVCLEYLKSIMSNDFFGQYNGGGVAVLSGIVDKLIRLPTDIELCTLLIILLILSKCCYALINNSIKFIWVLVPSLVLSLSSCFPWGNQCCGVLPTASRRWFYAQKIELARAGLNPI